MKTSVFISFDRNGLLLFFFYLDERAARGNEEEKDESKADIEQNEKTWVCLYDE